MFEFCRLYIVYMESLDALFHRCLVYSTQHREGSWPCCHRMDTDHILPSLDATLVHAIVLHAILILSHMHDFVTASPF